MSDEPNTPRRTPHPAWRYHAILMVIFGPNSLAMGRFAAVAGIVLIGGWAFNISGWRDATRNGNLYFRIAMWIGAALVLAHFFDEYVLNPH